MVDVKLRISITKRSNDYMAEYTDNPGIWDAGKTKEQAVFNLLVSLQASGIVKLYEYCKHGYEANCPENCN